MDVIGVSEGSTEQSRKELTQPCIAATLIPLQTGHSVVKRGAFSVTALFEEKK